MYRGIGAFDYRFDSCAVTRLEKAVQHLFAELLKGKHPIVILAVYDFERLALFTVGEEHVARAFNGKAIAFLFLVQAVFDLDFAFSQVKDNLMKLVDLFHNRRLKLLQAGNAAAHAVHQAVDRRSKAAHRKQR